MSFGDSGWSVGRIVLMWVLWVGVRKNDLIWVWLWKWGLVSCCIVLVVFLKCVGFWFMLVVVSRVMDVL